MYGMVNQALEDMATAAHGEDVWLQIRRRAVVDVEYFLTNEGYPDELTYRLVGAASEVLATPAETLLHAFGVHWVTVTAAKGYGHLMQASGANVKEFLQSLPNFHTRVNLIFPHLEPPRFSCTGVEENSLVLNYFSHRRGLAPFVEGLLHGLGQYFSTPVEVRQLTEWNPSGGHDSFLIRWN
jgi:hypothetical protein